MLRNRTLRAATTVVVAGLAAFFLLAGAPLATASEANATSPSIRNGPASHPCAKQVRGHVAGQPGTQAPSHHAGDGGAHAAVEATTTAPHVTRGTHRPATSLAVPPSRPETVTAGRAPPA